MIIREQIAPPHQSLTRQLSPEGKPISKSGLVLAAVAVYFMRVQIFPREEAYLRVRSCLKDSVSIVFSKKVDIF